MLIELIKLVCKEHKECNDNCPFYIACDGCPFLGPPANWPSESEILKRLEESKNE